MRTAEEILKEWDISTLDDYNTHFENIKNAVNQARKEAIEECIKVSKTKWEQGHKHPESVYVDKEPLLNLIKELK